MSIDDNNKLVLRWLEDFKRSGSAAYIRKRVKKKFQFREGIR